MNDYKKRLTEVDEILNYLSEEELEKIPAEIRKAIRDNKDNEYEWEYDEEKTLKEQNLSRDTIAFLSYLNMEYLLNEEQKTLMKEIHKLNDRKVEEAKKKKYAQNTFNNKLEKEEKVVEEKKELVEYKENIFIKMFKKLKSIFTKA